MMNLLGFIMSLVYMQAVHGWLSTYERLVNSQNFLVPTLTQEDLSRFGRDYIEAGRYRADYDAQEQALQAQLDKLRSSAQDDPLALPWVKELLTLGHLTELDRPTVAAAIREIRVYDGNRIEIDYLLPESCRALLEGRVYGVPFWVKRKRRAYRNVFNVRREKLVA